MLDALVKAAALIGPIHCVKSAGPPGTRPSLQRRLGRVDDLLLHVVVEVHQARAGLGRRLHQGAKE